MVLNEYYRSPVRVASGLSFVISGAERQSVGAKPRWRLITFTVNDPFFLKEHMKIERPQAEQRKISYKDDFELCYMRHTYIRRVDYNPTEKDMLPYMGIITHQAKNTFYTYKNLFQMIGFIIDDIINIGRIHLIGFLGLYSLEKVPEKYEQFEEVFFNKFNHVPQDKDIKSKDKANFTMQLKQRMETLVRVCRQKARNIKGFPTEEYYVFYGPKRPPKDLRKLLENNEKYHFKKLDMASFKSIKKKMKIKGNDKPFKFSGYWYIAVPLEQRTLNLTDFAGAGLDPYDSIHNKNPEEILFDKLDNKEFEQKKAIFDSHSDKRKETLLRNFIRKNLKNPLFKEEIDIARKYIKDMGN